MNAPVTKGWCPTLLTPMESGDGYLVRVKPVAAQLTATAAVAVADAAVRYGNGIIDITNRGNLQIRGLTPEAFDPFAEGMLSLGLANADPRAEAVRNVMVDPLGPDDPAAQFDSHDLARRLSAMLEGDPAYYSLPDKFGLMIDGGDAFPLTGAAADIMVRGAGGGLRIDLGGGDKGIMVDKDAVIAAIGRIITAFQQWRKSRPDARRMRNMVADIGAREVFHGAGVAGDPAEVNGSMAEAHPPVGFAPLTPDGRGVFGLGAPFGQLEADSLKLIADLSDRHADGTLRITPWKSILLVNVNADGASAIGDAAGQADLIVDGDDPRRHIVTCPGRPRCTSAHADTMADAAVLATRAVAGEGLVHISGCAKGCAHPRAAPLTLVAGATGYAVVRDGCAVDAPAIEGLSLDDLTAYLDRSPSDRKVRA